jgi:elongation factor P
MATTADIRNGLMIRFKHDIYEVVEFLHVKPGKGPAFVRTKLKSVKNGRVLDHTFDSGEKLEDVRIERHKFQFLYKDGNDFIFQNLENWEQVNGPEHTIRGVAFLAEGMECEVVMNADDESVLSIDLPNFAVLEITYCEPGLKGDTATNTLKPATLENGVEVRVPLFVNQGDKIKVDTRTAEYVERAK